MGGNQNSKFWAETKIKISGGNQKWNFWRKQKMNSQAETKNKISGGNQKWNFWRKQKMNSQAETKTELSGGNQKWTFGRKPKLIWAGNVTPLGHRTRTLALRQKCQNNIFFFSNPFFPLIRLNPGIYKLKFTYSIERVTSKDDHKYILWIY